MTNHIGYTSLTPTDTGVEWAQVSMTDLGGSIPDMMKGKIVTR